MKILAITGSLRAASSNTAFIRAIANQAPTNLTFDIYRELGTLPLFSPDLDTASPPAQVTHLRSRIDAADAVIICTPEYAYGMPGALKNALDWLVSSAQLYQKPVAALSASPSARGGDRALAWLMQTLTALDAQVPEGASFPVPYVKTKLEDNRICDRKTHEQLENMFIALHECLG